MKREDLINTKVYVDGRSAEIQRKLFELGIFWNNGAKDILHIEAPFLFIEEKMDGGLGITYGINTYCFTENACREITVSDILGICIEHECKPLQEHQKWEYKQVVIEPTSDCVDINALGKEGWELCSSVCLADRLSLYFKRPII